VLLTASVADVNAPFEPRAAVEVVATKPEKFGVPKLNTYLPPDDVRYFDASQPVEDSAHALVVATPRSDTTLDATWTYAMTGVFVPD
jgi:hypothetical protein